MGADPLLLNLPSGTFELRKPRLDGGAQTPTRPAPLRHVESGLRSALWSKRRAMIELLGPGHATALMLNDPEALIRALLQALEMGRLELAPPNEGKPEGSADDAAWAAYSAFQAQIGREFTVAARSHRLVPRERVGAVQSERDYDVVPASEATSIVATVGKTKASGSLSAHMKVLLASICDMRAPSKQEGFVLLRAPITQAARYVAPEDVITPAKLKKLAEKDWIEIELVDEQGNPWTGPYELLLPGGEVQRGTVGEDGIVRVENIRSGACNFSLPELDAGCWGPGAAPRKAKP